MPQEIETELEIVDRHALVRGVDQPRGQIVVHCPGGKEAVGDGTEGLAQPVAVGEPQAADRHRTRFRLVLHGYLSPESRAEVAAAGAFDVEVVPPSGWDQ